MGELLIGRFDQSVPHGNGLTGQGADPAVKTEAGARERQRLWQQIWQEAPGIGWCRLQQLIEAFGNLEQAWQATASELDRHLAQPTRLGRRGLERVLAYRNGIGPAPLSRPIRSHERQRWGRRRVLICGDASLPEGLEALQPPPLQLHWQGRGSLWPHLRQRQAVAVVGTRRPSRHGEAMARQIGQALAEAGWPVVSGLAEGIDAAAHQGCLEAGGRPVAILGTPLNRVYPRHHAALQRRVGEQGLLISELPPDAAVRAGHFAQRNRLQVAMARALVLVECPVGSGALHSAKLAWEQELPLWVVPADAARISAAGSNRWLGHGASPLLEPADLLASLGPGPLARGVRPGATSAPPGPADAAGTLPVQEAALLAAIGSGASLMQLSQRLRQEPQRLSERLLHLELAGMLLSEPGLWWRPR